MVLLCFIKKEGKKEILHKDKSFRDWPECGARDQVLPAVKG